MRIVIDLQGMQSMSKSRGIGRYSHSLIQALARNRGRHEIVLVLNGFFTDSIAQIRSEFEGLLSDGCIHIWYPPGDVSFVDGKNEWRRNAAQLIREVFIANLSPDVVLVSSMIEGFADTVAVSIGKIVQAVPTAVIFYDLIPLIHSKIYLANQSLRNWYEDRLDNLRRADILLAISESSRQEAIEHLGFSQERAISISAAADGMFRPITVNVRIRDDILRRYGITRPFLMYTGGADFRKNVDGLLRAYAALPLSLRTSHQLAIVCELDPAKQNLKDLCAECGLKDDELVFTGFVPEGDLLLLYNLCKCFVFPSWHEGFGLPALEAMSCGRAVIGSNATSITEVIGCQEALFDPHDVRSMADLMERVLVDEQFRAKLENHGLARSKNFSWDLSAKAALAALERLAEDRMGKNEDNGETSLSQLINEVARTMPATVSERELVRLAHALSLSFPRY